MTGIGTLAQKRANFTMVKCPACNQNFKTTKEQAATLKLPDDCPICREKNSAMEDVSIDPTAVVDPKRLLARQVVLEGMVRAMQQDINTILTSLALRTSASNVVDTGTSTAPAAPTE
jgi:NAD-dependent SIR2 family protein deacetylase